MQYMNDQQIIGNLGGDPILRETTGGKKVCNFRVAVNSGIKNEEKNTLTTTWFDCVAWDGQAEYVKEHFKKGTLVFVAGSMRAHKWEREVEAPATKEKFKVSVESMNLVVNRTFSIDGKQNVIVSETAPEDIE